MQTTLFESWEIHNAPVLVVGDGADLSKITNEVGIVISYSGDRPYYLLPSTYVEPYQVGGCI